MTQLAISKLTSLLLFVTAVGSPNYAFGVEALSTAKLVEHCAYYSHSPQGVDAIFCRQYVQGFIDGAIATDETVMNNVAAQYEKNESFLERALRTRSPSRASTTNSASVFAGFCLGPEVPLDEVVEHVINDLSNWSLVDGSSLARDTVYTVLKRDYPCETRTEQ